MLSDHIAVCMYRLALLSLGERERERERLAAHMRFYRQRGTELLVQNGEVGWHKYPVVSCTMHSQKRRR